MFGKHYKKRAERDVEDAITEAEAREVIQEGDDADADLEAIQREEWAKSRSIPQDENLAVQLVDIVHDHTCSEVPEKVKSAGGVFISKQMAFSNLTKDEAEQFKCDGTALRYMRFNALDPMEDNDEAMVDLAQLEALINVQITKGRDFTERKATVTQLVGTFQRAVAEKRKGGVYEGLKRRIGG